MSQFLKKPRCQMILLTFFFYMKARYAENVTGDLVGETVPQRNEAKQLEEAKNALEVQLKEIKLQLERDGFTSVGQMRWASVSMGSTVLMSAWLHSSVCLPLGVRC